MPAEQPQPEHRSAREQCDVVRALFDDPSQTRPAAEFFEVGNMAGMLLRFDRALNDICSLDPMGSERAEMMRRIAWAAVNPGGHDHG